jgi:hypothetical protein
MMQGVMREALKEAEFTVSSTTAFDDFREALEAKADKEKVAKIDEAFK